MAAIFSEDDFRRYLMMSDVAEEIKNVKIVCCSEEVLKHFQSSFPTLSTSPKFDFIHPSFLLDKVTQQEAVVD